MKADDVVSDVVGGLGVVGAIALPDARYLELTNKCSITALVGVDRRWLALTQQLPLRLMLRGAGVLSDSVGIAARYPLSMAR